MSLGLKGPTSGDAGLPSTADGDLSEIAVDDLDISEEELGRGAFGCVFRAHYFGTEVAIKKMKIPNDADLKKFMKREVIILKSMRHPHIVQFVGVSKLADSLLIITEYAKGGDLHQSLKSNGNLYGMWKSKITLAQQIASAMSYLHSKKIIFRDLKAKNILVNDKTRPTIAKICDFGFARVLDKTQTSASNYLTICGTDDWMAPEVILGMEYDEKSDVFSYGVLLLEFIIGTRTVKRELKRHPYQSFELDLDKVRSLAPKSCPTQFLDLAIFCCAYEPKSRPDFKSVVIAIGKVLQDPKAVDMSPEEVLATKQVDDEHRASLHVEPEPEVEEAYDYDEAYDDVKSEESASKYDLNDLYSKVKGVSFYANGSSYRSTTSSVGDLSAESGIAIPGTSEIKQQPAEAQPEATPTPAPALVATPPSPTINSSNSNNNSNASAPKREASSPNTNNTKQGGLASIANPIITIFNHIFTTSPTTPNNSSSNLNNNQQNK